MWGQVRMHLLHAGGTTCPRRDWALGLLTKLRAPIFRFWLCLGTLRRAPDWHARPYFKVERTIGSSASGYKWQGAVCAVPVECCSVERRSAAQSVTIYPPRY